jgi:flavin-dependent dehydrogenase
LPKINKRIIEIHGGAIPRVKPYEFKDIRIGDSTGLIKTFTGGGIFSISFLIDSLLKGVKYGKWDDYNKKLNLLKKEIKKQYIITILIEKFWKILPIIFYLFRDKTIYIKEEFDFHSLLLFKSY